MGSDPGDTGGIAGLADLIAAEHRAIVEMLEALASERHDRFPLAHRLIDELAAHTAAEQFLLYPALRDIVPGGIAMADQAPVEENQLLPSLRETIGSDKMVELAAIYTQVKESFPSGLQGLAPDMPEPEFRPW